MFAEPSPKTRDLLARLRQFFDQHIYPNEERYYRELARPWGPTLSADQYAGGGVLWATGDLVGLLFFGTLIELAASLLSTPMSRSLRTTALCWVL